MIEHPLLIFIFSIQDDPSVIAAAKERDHYSHVFKIVLHPIAEEDSEMFRRRRGEH